MLTRLLVVTPGFPADKNDTSCLPPVQTFVRGFARLQPAVDVRVVSLQYPYSRRAYRWHGLSVHPCGGGNRGGHHKPATWYRAWREIAGWPCDLIHSFWMGECALLASAAARRFGCGHVASIGGQELRRATVYSRLLRRANFPIVAGSVHASKTAQQTLGRGADAIIPLGLDLDDIDAARRSNTADERDIDVLYVGSIIPLKRVQDVVSVAQSLPTLRFVVVGNGPLRSSLERSAPTNVDFRGQLRRKDVLQLMQRSSVLLHPSEYESQGYVFLEALASGMHVVCRDTGFAGDSDNVHRCGSVEDMQSMVDQLLRRQLGHKPVPVPTVTDTVRAYSRLYESAITSSQPVDP